jgi:hypothetical protein
MTSLMLVSALAASRLLSESELSDLAPDLKLEQVVTSQAFSFEPDGPSVVPFREGAELRARLYYPLTGCAAWRAQQDSATPRDPVTVELGLEATVDAVSFVDLDWDGVKELVLIVSTKGGAPLQRVVVVGHPALGEQLRKAVVGPLTMARLATVLRPKFVPVRASCRRLPLPLAFSGDRRLALLPDLEIVTLATGAPPRWWSNELRQAVRTTVQVECHWERDSDAIHGGYGLCANPVQPLNTLLKLVPGAPADFVAAPDALKSAGRAGNGWLELDGQTLKLPPECGEARARLQLTSAVLFASNEELNPSLYQVPDSAADCFCGGGTCIHDIVEEPTPRPEVTVITLKR